ncbi:RAB6-interacting golgin isoform X2 [Battus philenor]|uniref:RAB6-interacting golgin isoform X2 n=1 Tax=Battus philenor TaxID=42288 RepID=UPI0035CF2D3E
MTSTFTGFSEEDLKRIKSAESVTKSVEEEVNLKSIRKFNKLQPKKGTKQHKLQMVHKQESDDAIDHIEFSKCKLSIKSPTLLAEEDVTHNEPEKDTSEDKLQVNVENGECNSISGDEQNNNLDSRKNSTVLTFDNYNEEELAMHREKLQQLQLQQRLMEEQNKKRKEMLAKALADRTRQTEEEVLRLEKIKKELQVLDGQFSQDVAVLRKKIDQACLNYTEAEKQYLKIEKEFLQAKIHLQKEKEKKELLTEHLCALITHNETRKAQKLETLMLELASDRSNSCPVTPVEDASPVIIDGVDQRTGKMVEIQNES